MGDPYDFGSVSSIPYEGVSLPPLVSAAGERGNFTGGAAASPSNDAFESLGRKLAAAFVSGEDPQGEARRAAAREASGRAPPPRPGDESQSTTDPLPAPSHFAHEALQDGLWLSVAILEGVPALGRLVRVAYEHDPADTWWVDPKTELRTRARAAGQRPRRLMATADSDKGARRAEEGAPFFSRRPAASSDADVEAASRVLLRRHIVPGGGSTAPLLKALVALPPPATVPPSDEAVDNADDPDAPFPLMALPDECVSVIARHLPACSLAAFASTCGRLRDIASDERLWKVRSVSQWGAKHFPLCSNRSTEEVRLRAPRNGAPSSHSSKCF